MTDAFGLARLRTLNTDRTRDSAGRKVRATDCSRPATPVREGRSPLSRSCNPNSLITKAGVRGHRKTRPRTLRGGEARVGYPAS